MTKMRNLMLGLTLALAASVGSHTTLAQTQDIGILTTGDAVVTGFSGVVDPVPPDPVPPTFVPLDETFINTDGISARITPLSSPGYRWDARVWQGSSVKDFKAGEIGQVFGVTLDDEKFPNIYVTATSNYGLHIVEPDKDNDTRPERLKTGQVTAQWMAGMWGTTDAKDPVGSVGGPGSIWKIDGKTGDVSLFANITLNGAENGGAGLGNITYDRAHKQLFVSDLSTGMIHRLDLNGQELEVWDAGVAGMTEAGKPPVPYDPAGQLDITSSKFDSEDVSTWGFTDKNRRVYALAPYGGRLYYALVGENQIWSVGIDDKTGVILQDAQWELDVPTKPNKLPVTDMLFTHQGAMILAQRGNIESTYDYANFADPGRARVYRYWLESPKDDPATPSRWIPVPEEYAVGFDTENRGTDGGIALNHGYTKEGYIDPNVCEASLWTTADNLRRDEALKKELEPGGPLVIDGLQGMPTGPVKQYPPEKNNTPPWVSYMLDVEPINTDGVGVTDDPLRWSDVTTQGWMGDVAILRGCGGGLDGGLASAGGGGGGGYYGWPTDYPYWTNTSGGCIVGSPNCPPPPPPGCIIGVNCPPPPPPRSCAKAEGKFVCDPKTGTYTFVGTITTGPGVNFDKAKSSNTSPGHILVGGPVLPYSAPSIPFTFTNAGPGHVVGTDFCLFNEAEMKSGKPFACCKIAFDEQAPTQVCKKK